MNQWISRQHYHHNATPAYISPPCRQSPDWGHRQYNNWFYSQYRRSSQQRDKTPHLCLWNSTCTQFSSSSQLTADCPGPVSVAIPTAGEDSLSMADVNYQMLVGPAGPGSTMPAELSVTSSDPEGPHPHTQHQVYSTPSQESSCGGHEHSCLVVGKLFWWVFKNNLLFICIHNWLHYPDHEVSGSVLVYSLFVFYPLAPVNWLPLFSNLYTRMHQGQYCNLWQLGWFQTNVITSSS